MIKIILSIVLIEPVGVERKSRFRDPVQFAIAIVKRI